MKYYIGIDPGLTGAIAVISEQGANYIDIPLMQNGKGSSIIKKKVDPYGIYNYLSGYINNLEKGDSLHAVIEQVNSRPGQGVSSVFSLGESIGCIRSALEISKIPIQYVTPAKWKKFYGLPSDKEYSRTKAMELFPELRCFLDKKKHHNRAEALLLANYAKHVFGG